MYDTNAALRGIHDDIEEGNIVGRPAVKDAVGTVIIRNLTSKLEKNNHDSEHIRLVRQALTHAASGDLNQFNEQLDGLPVKVLKDLHSTTVCPRGAVSFIAARKLKPIIKSSLDVQVKELEKALRARPEKKLVDRLKEIDLAQTDKKAHEIQGLLHVTDNALVNLAVSKLNHLSFAQKAQLAKNLGVLIRNKKGLLKAVHAYDVVDKVRSTLGKLSQEDYSKLKQDIHAAIGKARNDVIEMTSEHELVKQAAFDSSRHLEKTMDLAFSPASKQFKFNWKRTSRK